MGIVFAPRRDRRTIWRGESITGGPEMKPLRAVIVLDVIVVLVILAFNFFSFDAQLAMSALS